MKAKMKATRLEKEGVLVSAIIAEIELEKLKRLGVYSKNEAVIDDLIKRLKNELGYLL